MALNEITPDNTATVRSTGMQTTVVQVAAVDGRLGTLRGGGGAGFSASGFNVSVADLALSSNLVKSFLTSFDQNNPAFMQTNVSQNDSDILNEFGRWGVWVSGRLIFGKKDPTTRQVDYDFNTAGLTFGMDYRFTDKFVAGVAVGYADTNADLGIDDGELDTKGYSVSLYGTWFQSDRFYIGGSLAYGSNDYDQRRNVKYVLDPTTTSRPFFNVDQEFTAEYDGTQMSAALSGGWDFNKNGWTFGPTFRVSYVDVDVDAYDEILIQSNNPSTIGWAVHIDDQTYKSLQPSIGFEFSKAISQSWGVFIPQGYIDVVSELKDGETIISGKFIGDVFEDQTGINNDFHLLTDDFEETFARAGLGFGFILKNNKQAFFMVDADLGRDLLKTYYINAGFRWQF
jgi:outer membrane autotransporter protein